MKKEQRSEHVNIAFPNSGGKRQGIVFLRGNASRIRRLDPIRDNIPRRLDRLEKLFGKEI